jgi:hypothetical protein
MQSEPGSQRSPHSSPAIPTQKRKRQEPKSLAFRHDNLAILAEFISSGLSDGPIRGFRLGGLLRLCFRPTSSLRRSSFLPLCFRPTSSLRRSSFLPLCFRPTSGLHRSSFLLLCFQPTSSLRRSSFLLLCFRPTSGLHRSSFLLRCQRHVFQPSSLVVYPGGTVGQTPNFRRALHPSAVPAIQRSVDCNFVAEEKVGAAPLCRQVQNLEFVCIAGGSHAASKLPGFSRRVTSPTALRVTQRFGFEPLPIQLHADASIVTAPRPYPKRAILLALLLREWAIVPIRNRHYCHSMAPRSQDSCRDPTC